MSQDSIQHNQKALDAEMAELEAASAKADDIDQKLDHVRRMAEGEIMTCLGPADRHALRMLISELENHDAAFDKLSDAYGDATGLLAEWIDCGQSDELGKRTNAHLHGDHVSEGSDRGEK